MDSFKNRFRRLYLSGLFSLRMREEAGECAREYVLQILKQRQKSKGIVLDRDFFNGFFAELDTIRESTQQAHKRFCAKIFGLDKTVSDPIEQDAWLCWLDGLSRESSIRLIEKYARTENKEFFICLARALSKNTEKRRSRAWESALFKWWIASPKSPGISLCTFTTDAISQFLSITTGEKVSTPDRIRKAFRRLGLKQCSILITRAVRLRQNRLEYKIGKKWCR